MFGLGVIDYLNAKGRKYSNEGVCKAFLNGAEKGKSNRIFIEGNVIYSYGHHFPLAVRLKDCYLLNSDKYSVTTSCHQNILRRLLNGFKVIEVNTETIKDIISSGVKSFSEYQNIVVVENL